MKTNNRTLLFSIWAMITLMACTPNAPKEEDLFKPDEANTIASLTEDGRLYTLQELKDSFLTEQGNYKDTVLEAFYRTRANNGDDIWYFSIDTFPSAGAGIYVMGRICTDDAGGNNYKSIILQQMVNGEQQNLRVSVDVGSIGGLFPMGQKVLIRCNGLAIGKYSNQVQLCSPSYNNNIYAQNATQKVGWQPGRIPGPIFHNAVVRIGTPYKDSLYYEEMTMAEIWDRYIKPYSTDPVACRRYDARLVRIKDVHFTGEYESGSTSSTPTMCNAYIAGTEKDSVGNPASDKYANVFAPTTENIGFPQTRYVADKALKHRLKISVGEYAKFANYFLPSIITAKENPEPNECVLSFNYAACSGSIDGILGYYVDKASTMTSKYDAIKPYNWSVVPSNITDICFKDTAGNDWKPVEFAKYMFTTPDTEE